MAHKNKNLLFIVKYDVKASLSVCPKKEDADQYKRFPHKNKINMIKADIII